MAGQWRWTRRADAQSPAAAQGRVSEGLACSAAGAEALDKLLGEVRDLRLTFVTDLSMAAGAVEDGATDVAADILDADRAELARFFRAADDRLRELEQAAHREPVTNVVPMPIRPRSGARRKIAVALPAIPLVGALTMAAAAAAGVLPVPGTSNAPAHHSTTSAIAVEDNALRQFETVVNSDPSEQQVIAAANKLHQQIAALIKTSKGDPSQANAIVQLLQAEQALLLSKEPPGTQTVLALIQQFAHHTTTLSAASALSTHPADVTAPSNTTSSTKPSPSPSPTKSAKPSPTPTHSSSPSPSSSPSSSSNTGPLPKVGG